MNQFSVINMIIEMGYRIFLDTNKYVNINGDIIWSLKAYCMFTMHIYKSYIESSPFAVNTKRPVHVIATSNAMVPLCYGN